MGVLEEIGKAVEPALTATSPQDAPNTSEGDGAALHALIEQNRRLMERLQSQPKPKPKEKKPNPKPPFILRNLPKYPVYLVLPKNMTAHTYIYEFKKDGKTYYLLEWNKTVYSESDDEFVGEEKLLPTASNLIFLKDGRLHMGKWKFSQTAQGMIDSAARWKQKDRAFEKSRWTQKRKFANPQDLVKMAIAIIMICLGVFLVLYVMFGGLPQSISAINAAATIAPPPVANNTFVVT